MAGLYNVYCDESCHLENDGQPVMVLGAVWCPKDAVRDLSDEIAGLKKAHHANGELKWGKVSGANVSFYNAVTDWFVSSKNINFRGLVVTDKSKLNHEAFNKGGHDEFYYKMYFSLLREVLSHNAKYEIYLDIKDSRSRRKVAKLKEVLCFDKYDFTSEMIVNLQNIRSHESHILQVADFIAGAVSYKHRYVMRSPQSKPSEGKLRVLAYLEKTTNTDFGRSTSRFAEKFNLFCFKPRLMTR